MSAARKTGEEIDTSKTYVFSTTSTTLDLVLSVNRNPMDAAASAPLPPTNSTTPVVRMISTSRAGNDGQWFLTKVNSNQPGNFYRLHPASLGVGQSLDVVNEGGAVNSTKVKMAASGDAPGQAWAFDRWSGDDADGYRLSNRLTGPDVHLDITGAPPDPHLFGGDFPGQHWLLREPGQPASAPAPGQPILSTAAIVGLAMVAALGLGLLIFGLVRWLWWSRRKTNRRPVGMIWATPDPFQVARKSSFQSFRSGQGHDLHPLETAVVARAYASDEVSPESTYRDTQGRSFFHPHSNVDTLDLAPGAVEPWPGMVAELPDKRYTLNSSRW